MSERTLTFTGELVVETCWCGIAHAVPRQLLNEQQRKHDNGEKDLGIYCPLGHSWVPSSKPAIEIERERRKAVEAQLSTTRDELAATRHTLDEERTKSARARKRAPNGVCPCCKRSFVNVARHIAGQHPDFVRDGE